MKKLYVVGIGPGEYDMMTGRAIASLQSADVIVGYQVYTELVKEYFPGKEIMTTPMRQEVERCRMAVREAAQGRVVAMISSGDAGIYGMAGLMYEVLEEEGLLEQIELEIVAGVTAANAGAAWLGAPLMHDFAVISLSDLLTPWEVIAKRLRACAGADMGIVPIIHPAIREKTICKRRVTFCWKNFHHSRYADMWKILTGKAPVQKYAL